MSGPNVLVTVQRPLYRELTTEASRAKLHRLAGNLVFNESEDPWSQSDVIERIGGSGRRDKRLGKLHVRRTSP